MDSAGLSYSAGVVLIPFLKYCRAYFSMVFHGDN